MSTTSLRLDPVNAALSIKARIETIDQCLAYIRETVKRYDGLKSFEAELAKYGIGERVGYIATPVDLDSDTEA